MAPIWVESIISAVCATVLVMVWYMASFGNKPTPKWLIVATYTVTYLASYWAIYHYSGG